MLTASGVPVAAVAAALLALAVLVLPRSRAAAPPSGPGGARAAGDLMGGGSDASSRGRGLAGSIGFVSGRVIGLRWPVLAAALLGVAGGAGAVVGVAVGVAVAVVGAAGVLVVRDAVIQRESARMLETDLAVCEALVAELQSGAALAPALRAAGSGVGDLPAALRQAASAVAVAGRPAEILADSGSDTAQRVGSVLAIATDRGIAPAVAIEALRSDLVHRRDHRNRLAGLLAGPNASAALLAGLPVLGLLMGQGMGADPVAVLTSTTAGGIALVAGAALTAVGLVWSRRIVAGAREAA